MDMRYAPDWTQQLTVATSSTNSTLSVPQQTNNDAVNNPRNVGSLWFVSVDGVPCAVNQGAPAVYSTMFKLGVGANLVNPVFLQPGAVLNLITASAAGSFSIVRARMVG